MNMCHCENCGRTNSVAEIICMSIQGHVAELCVTCTHILSQASNQDRFLSIVRQKTAQQSNAEMKRVHRLLTGLIAVGMLAIVVIAGVVGAAENLGTVVDQSKDHSNIEYLSFAILNQFK
ncbi:DNA polymerase III subunit delta [Lysinibacillus sp. 54212]|uniref:DNA polymerase III subunit delta n=1 Tax=Lysinibacillus sp. 54212 TaxID=3119829 RepID=UPI002FC974BB